MNTALCGTTNGASVTETPLTSTRLNTFAPITFPSDSAPCPFARDVIAVGANLLVENGTLIAQAFGVPESVIALTFVALGTSLPELVTAITSLAKGHGALSLGNVIGANVFNLVLVSGVSVTLAPFVVPQSAVFMGHNSSLVLEIPVMLLVMSILTIPTLIRGKLTRAQGILLLVIYAVFCAIQFTM